MRGFRVLPVLLVLFAGFPAIAAADFDKAVEAYLKQDYVTAFKQWAPLAQQGHARAQNNLGVMYSQGQGTVKNQKMAIRLYRLAAAQQDADAENNLGWMYENGQGVARDENKAVNWYRLAAEQGDTEALEILLFRARSALPAAGRDPAEGTTATSGSDAPEIPAASVRGGHSRRV